MTTINLAQANTIVTAALAKGREMGLKPLTVAVLFLSPLLLLGAVSLVIYIPPGSPGYYWSAGIAGGLCLLIGVFQAWRWIVGYARPSWHEAQAGRRASSRFPKVIHNGSTWGLRAMPAAL